MYSVSSREITKPKKGYLKRGAFYAKGFHNSSSTLSDESSFFSTGDQFSVPVFHSFDNTITQSKPDVFTTGRNGFSNKIYKRQNSVPNTLHFEECEAHPLTNRAQQSAFEFGNANDDKNSIKPSKIDVLHRTEFFTNSSLDSLQRQWKLGTFGGEKNQKSNVSSRQERLEQFREQNQQRLIYREALVKKQKHAKYVGLWRKAIKRITRQQQERKLRLHLYWVNASKELMRKHFKRKSDKVHDQYELLCSEMGRLLANEWHDFKQKDFSLDDVMQEIENDHQRKLVEEIKAKIKEDEKMEHVKNLRLKIKTKDKFNR